jgi:NDP-sugar pyrophosphorylase family protein
MRAVILAGGKGTRLAPYTTVLPKPLMPVGDRPIIELVIRQLASYGFDRIDLCLGHLGNLIRAYLSETEVVPEGVDLRYVWEERPLGTAGALRLIERPT